MQILKFIGKTGSPSRPREKQTLFNLEAVRPGQARRPHGMGTVRQADGPAFGGVAEINHQSRQ